MADEVVTPVSHKDFADLPLTPQVNHDACMAIIKQIGKYPEAGLPLLIADILMDGVNGIGRSPIGINEMARVAPEGAFCAKRINEVHRASNIPRIVTSDEAIDSVLGFAMDGMDYVRQRVIEIAPTLGLDLPAQLLAHTVRRQIDTTDGTERYEINRPVAYELADFLRNDDLRLIVSQRIKDRATEMRQGSAEQQARVAARGQELTRRRVQQSNT